MKSHALVLIFDAVFILLVPFGYIPRSLLRIIFLPDTPQQAAGSFIHVTVDAWLGKATDYEVDLAIDHLKKTQPGDLIIADRGYASYFFLARLK